MVVKYVDVKDETYSSPFVSVVIDGRYKSFEGVKTIVEAVTRIMIGVEN